MQVLAFSFKKKISTVLYTGIHEKKNIWETVTLLAFDTTLQGNICQQLMFSLSKGNILRLQKKVVLFYSHNQELRLGLIGKQPEAEDPLKSFENRRVWQKPETAS